MQSTQHKCQTYNINIMRQLKGAARVEKNNHSFVYQWSKIVTMNLVVIIIINIPLQQWVSRI